MNTFNRAIIALLLLVSGLGLSTSEAKVIQILHTNDLHAAIRTAGAPADGESEMGGWGQIKTIMDRLTLEAKNKGIETVRLDAGDFLEGTMFYFSDHGKNVMKAFQNIGYDAVALGNHDWLMGPQNMDVTFGENPFPFPILSANTEISPWLKNLRKQISATTQIVRDGIKIGIVGLSTDEMAYKWITKVDSYKNDMIIHDYRDHKDLDGTTDNGIGNQAAENLRQDNDVVLALTHIGIDEDKKLAASSKNFDLIVGGHSHTFIDKPVYVANQKGEQIPIVQTGVNGKYIGRIVLDVEPGKKAKILSYELVPVPITTAQDPKIAKVLVEAEKAVNDQYTPEKLNQVVGKSTVNLVSGDGGKTAYSQFVVDAMREMTGADLAVDLGAFHGNGPQEKGDITYRKLMEMYPRKLNVEQNEGLYVYHARIPGWVLKLALKLTVKYGYDLSTSGIDYTTYFLNDEDFAAEKQAVAGTWKEVMLSNERLLDASINGRPIRTFEKYNLAVPEFFVRGAYAITFLSRLLIRHGRPTAYTIWDASADYLSEIGVLHDLDPPKGPATGSEKRKRPPSAGFMYANELLDQLAKDIQSAPEFSSLKDDLK